VPLDAGPLPPPFPPSLRWGRSLWGGAAVRVCPLINHDTSQPRGACGHVVGLVSKGTVYTLLTKPSKERFFFCCPTNSAACADFLTLRLHDVVGCPSCAA
jgi:hypothetical protein